MPKSSVWPQERGSGEEGPGAEQARHCVVDVMCPDVPRCSSSCFSCDEGVALRSSLVKCCLRRKLALYIMKSETWERLRVERVGLSSLDCFAQVQLWQYQCPSWHLLGTILGRFYQLNAIQVR